MSEKQMSAAERAARQMMQDKKDAEAADKAYMRSLTSTSPAPAVKKAKGGMIGSASKRADGCAQRGKTRGKMI